MGNEQQPRQDVNMVNIDTEKTAPPPPPPDGGAKAWRSVAGAFLCQFCSFGLINALGTFQVAYEIILPSHSASSISWILTFQIFLMFFLSQPIGIAVDMFGARPVTIPCSILAVCGLISLSFSHQYYSIFLSQSICFGIGAAGTFMPGLVVAGQYFKHKRALALGVVACGSSLGGVIFPIFLAQLFAKVGFPATMRWTALMIGILLLIGNLLITSHNVPKGWAGRKNIFRISVFKNTGFCIYLAGAFVFFWGLFGPFNFLPMLAAEYPSTRSIALYTVSIINAASIPGRVVPSYFADKVGRLAIMTLFAYTSAIAVLVIWLPVNFYPTIAGVVVFALIFGFASGAFVSLMSACLIDMAGGHVPEIGAMLGIFMMNISFAALTGSPIEATIADHESGRHTGLIVFSGTAMLIGSLLINVAWIHWSRGQKMSAATKE